MLIFSTFSYALIAPIGTKNLLPLISKLNAPLSIVGGTCPSNVTYLVLLNALEPIDVTVDGIVKNSNALSE